MQLCLRRGPLGKRCQTASGGCGSSIIGVGLAHLAVHAEPGNGQLCIACSLLCWSTNMHLPSGQLE